MRELLLRPPELREQFLIRLRLFHRVEVFAQEIFDECDLEALRVGRLTDDGGNAREAGLACRAPAALACDQLIAGAVASHDHRLDDSGRLDGRRQLP